MPLFGVHESISGGFDQAVLRAAENGFDTVQIFSKNSNQWNAKEIAPEAAEAFQEALKLKGMSRPLIHDSYLINLASPKSDLLEKSIASFSHELERADRLGIDQVVMHPGSYTTSTESEGIARVAESFDTILATSPSSVMVLIETTAGQGTNLGSRFEQIAEMISRCSYADRLGVCMDTCHIFAAGYDFSTQEKYDAMMNEFDRIIGLDRLKAFHLNDSVKGLGSHVDRHEQIGRGAIGAEPFGFFVNDERLTRHPMYMETPKGTVEIDGIEQDWDRVNLQLLRGLIRS